MSCVRWPGKTPLPPTPTPTHTQQWCTATMRPLSAWQLMQLAQCVLCIARRPPCSNAVPAAVSACLSARLKELCASPVRLAGEPVLLALGVHHSTVVVGQARREAVLCRHGMVARAQEWQEAGHCGSAGAGGGRRRQRQLPPEQCDGVEPLPLVLGDAPVSSDRWKSSSCSVIDRRVVSATGRCPGRKRPPPRPPLPPLPPPRSPPLPDIAHTSAPRAAEAGK